MKLNKASLLATALLGGVASAQTSVTIYGLIDASVRYINNVGGSRLYSLASGDQQSSRLGFRGTEDLGGGAKALFVLEQGLNVDTGTLSQGGLAYGRQAYVGLGSNQFGTVTLGRQYDFMAELGTYQAVWSGTGTFDWNVGDFDRVAGQRVDNSLKYTYRQGGMYFGALYGFGEVADQTSKASSESLIAQYAGERFSIGAAGTILHDRTIEPFTLLGVSTYLGAPTRNAAGAPTQVAVDMATIYGFGANYKVLDNLTLLGLYTRNESKRGDFSETFQSKDVGVRYDATPLVALVLSYSKASMSGNSWDRVGTAVDYFLSKRTDLYVAAIYEKTSGDDVKATLFTVAPSGGSNQAAVLAGIRHKF